MITTAALLLSDAYMSAHNDDYEEPGPAGALFLLMVFMAFDYSMAQVIA